MLSRPSYPPGVPCWVDTSHADPVAAADFYGGLFGWDFEDRMPADQPGRYLMARLEGFDVAAIGSQPPGAPPMAVWNTYVAVESADAAVAAVREAGGTVLAEPFDVFDAGRMAVFADPGGAVLCVWQAGSHYGAQVVNAPGTWNWSDLNTRDLAGAEAFYSAVFGWEAKKLDLGETGATMWRLPGYAEFLEAHVDPELRSRHTEFGAPEGFSDAVGWANVMTDEVFPPEVPAHWSVTFSVADTEATARRTEELGGKVLVPPFEAAEFSRVATLADPQGAVFTVSSFDA